MKKTVLALAGLILTLAPQVALAQDAQEAPSEEMIITISKFKVPLGEDRMKVMQFIQEVMVPQEEANPNVQGFYVLNHFYGADAEDVLLVRAYASLGAIDTPCGEPCEAWAESMPKQGTPESDELMALSQVFMKYYSSHSDEIYSSTLGFGRN